ncbi:MAG: NUDIX domain-containing protein [Lactobacillus sp.]|jgi:8-oxo-dGTP pyrophosphatase MutT (NUDIX family)|nr:MAG: NUDIX domain-containing protein [Lactobacillus sp.]
MKIEVTSGAVVYRIVDQKIEYLLLQSMNEGNFWGFPKGHVEAGEDLLQTAHREIREETQLDLTINDQFHVTTEYDLPNGNHKKMTLYTAKLEQATDLTLQAIEIKNAGWFDYETARNRLTYDNLKQLLDDVNTYLTTK